MPHAGEKGVKYTQEFGVKGSKENQPPQTVSLLSLHVPSITKEGEKEMEAFVLRFLRLI